MPSRDVVALIVWPSLVTALLLTPAAYAGIMLSRKWLSPGLRRAAGILVLWLMILIGIKSMYYAAGSDWRDHVPWGSVLTAKLHYAKAIAAVGVLGLLWMSRRRLDRWSRFLSGLGYAFCVLAALRVIVLLWHLPPAGVAPAFGLTSSKPFLSLDVSAQSALVATRPRRVVWVIFDELDYDRLFGTDRSQSLEVPNFNWLAGASAFAENASSPASATIYSIPALLTGLSLTAPGIDIDASSTLWIEHAGQAPTPFTEQSTIFGAIRSAGLGASVLGFYHPYCKLFSLDRCDSFDWPSVGGTGAGLWANMPDYLSEKLGGERNWDQITARTIELLPEYLRLDDALTFIHCNFPHPPARHADAVLHLNASPDPLTEYSHNLELTDQVLGKIIGGLESQTPRHELLLVVSSDHWLRNMWYRASEREASRRVPLMIWKVGDTRGIRMQEPLNTVHTAALIAAFLSGTVSSQHDVADWWEHQSVPPTFVPGGT